jgi:putative protease
MVTRPEVLAPAGDEACLVAAINSGADAVYFGIRGHNARARANNFEIDDLPRIMALLHSHGVKGYVPMNILAFDHELDAVARAIEACDRAGVDALIVQDLGVCAIAREVAPGLPIHASTQMTCTDADSIALAESLGVTRIVLARELSLDDIALIRTRTSAELEVFVHGALCVSYSGQCLTSEAIGGRSANRGACAQACRLPYDLVVDGVVRPLGDVAYLLSPEDLEAAVLVPKLAALDVHCLKIEGRLKGPAYVAATTRLYRAAVDALGAADGGAGVGSGGGAASAEDVRAARLTFSRGGGPGFLAGVDHQRLVAGVSCDHVGVHVGDVVATKRLGAKTLLQLRLHDRLKRGDGVLVAGGRGGVGEKGGRVWALVDDDGNDILPDVADGVTLGSPWVWLGPDVDVGADKRLLAGLVGRRVYLTDDPASDKAVLARAERAPVRERVDVTVSGDIGVPFSLQAESARGLRASVMGDGVVEVAKGRPIDEATLRDKLGRLGDSPYVLGTLTIALPPGVSIPVSSLNRARRDLVERLSASGTGRRLGSSQSVPEVSNGGLPVTSSSPEVSNRVPTGRSETTPPPGLLVLCRSQTQAEAALGAGADGVWLDFLAMTGLSLSVQALRAAHPGRFIGVAPPRIRKPGEEKITRFLQGLPVDGFLVRGLGQLHERASASASAGAGDDDGDDDGTLWVGDFSLNVTNQRSAHEVLSRGLHAFTPSFDLDETQLSAFLSAGSGAFAEVVIHHPMPLFHTEHCVFAALLSEGKGHDYRTCGRPCEQHQVSLRDRAGMAHPVEADVGCRNTVFHEKAQSAAELVAGARAAGARRFRIELVREDAAAVAELVGAYRALLDDKASPKATLKRVRASGGYGVVKGSLRVLAQGEAAS